jgi:CHAT domain-containing protein
MKPRARIHPLFFATWAVLFFLSISEFGGMTFELPAETNPSAQTQGNLEEKLIKADKLATQGKGEEALKWYQDALADARALGNLRLESRALSSLGRMYAGWARYAEARQNLELALKLAEGIGDKVEAGRAFNSLGAVAQYMGQAEEARGWYRKAVDSAEAAEALPLEASALLNLATLDSPDRKVASLEKVVTISHRLGDKGLEAGACHQWGDHLFSLGEFAAAMEKLERAEALYQEADDRGNLAGVYTSMGRLQRVHGRAAEAIPFYEKALGIQKEIGDRVGVVQSLNAMGIAYAAQEDLRQAGEHYEKAYALALETGSPRVIDFMRGNLADNLIDREEYVRAASMLEEVLKRGADSNPVYRHIQLSRAYLKMGRLPLARGHADQAVDLSQKLLNMRPNALVARAKIREEQEDMTGALDDSREAIRVIEQFRSKLVPLDFMKQGFSGQYQSAYSLLIGLYLRSGQPEKGLEVTELARARAFLDLLTTKDVRLKTADESELALLRKTDLELRNQGIDPAAFVSSKNPGTATITKEAAGLLQHWKDARPELLSFIEATPLSVPQFVTLAQRLKSTLVSYWVADEALYLWVIQPNGPVFSRRVEVTAKRLSALIRNVSSQGASGNSEAEQSRQPVVGTIPGSAAKGEWALLYRLLIRPVRDFLPAPGGRLTVIPHGALMRLPFAALLDEKGRYLLEQYSLHYSPSASLLRFWGDKSPNQNPDRRYLLVANPILPPAPKGEKSLPALPGADDEVRSISRLLPGGQVSILRGAKADKRTVSQQMQNADVVHFATHSIIIDGRPLDSYLALASKNPPDNGQLLAKEIYGFDLHSELIILSSCRSGGGKVTGEGISALARAFQYAGAPSLIASLWDVPDQPANRLLPVFYSSWLHGHDKIDALRSAQLQMLGDLRKGRIQVKSPAGILVLPEHPALWAGFILLGQP